MFCVDYDKNIKLYSLINKTTFEQQNDKFHSLKCEQRCFSDFPSRNTVKLENVKPTFSSYRPLLSYPSVATPVLNNFHDQYSAF